MKKTTYAILITLLIPFLLSSEVIDHFNFGGNYNESGRKMLETENGVLILGHTFSNEDTHSDVYLISTDLLGNSNWERSYGGAGWDYGMDICPASDNSGYIIAGYTSSQGNGDLDFLLIKVDLAGNEVWSNTFGEVGREIATALCQAEDGGYYICGYTNPSGTEDDIMLVKASADGVEEWSQTYGTLKSETAHDIMINSAGNIVIAGSTGMYDIPGGAGRNRDMYFLKTDAEGYPFAEQSVWMLSSGQGGFDICYSFWESPQGDLYALGNSSAEGNEVMDITLLKMDSNLVIQWKTSYEIANIYDYGYSIGGLTTDSLLYITGTYYSSDTPGTGIYFKKLDLEGIEVDGEIYDLGCPAAVYDILETDEGNFLLAGHSSVGTNDKDALLVHISGLQADFQSSPETGHFPLEVEFEDRTTGSPVSWNWDLDGDGSFDSSEPNPVFSYTEAGWYNITLEVSDLYVTESITRESYVRIFDGESCLQFSNNESYVNAGSGSIPEVTDAFTLEAWIFPQSWGETTSFGGRILDKDSFGIYLCESHSSLNQHCLGLQLKTEETPLSFSSSSENSIDLNLWQHIAVTYDGINEVKIYIDGSESEIAQLNSPGGALLDCSDNDLILGRSSNLSWGYDGLIDEVRIWDTVRFQEDIQSDLDNLLNGDEPGTGQISQAVFR